MKKLIALFSLTLSLIHVNSHAAATETRMQRALSKYCEQDLMAVGAALCGAGAACGLMALCTPAACSSCCVATEKCLMCLGAAHCIVGQEAPKFPALPSYRGQNPEEPPAYQRMS